MSHSTCSEDAIHVMSTQQTPEQRLENLNITLPQPAKPVANYMPYAFCGNQLIISGQLPLQNSQLIATGKVGGEISQEQATIAARLCMINVIAQVKAAIGELSKVKRVVRLGGFIASTTDFTGQASVLNGASDLCAEIFGEIGRHARSAVGVPVLPLDAPVEVEGLFELK